MRLSSNIVGSASNCIQFFEIQASAQLEPGFGFILMIKCVEQLAQAKYETKGESGERVVTLLLLE